MNELASKARTLLKLHQPGSPVVLPTVWDAWSATMAAKAGFAALTVGSHPVADAIGRKDGEGMRFEELTAQVRRITDTVDLPVSVDIESGYGLSAQTLIEGLLAAGAVGLNIEDTVHGEGGRLRGAQEHADVVAALRAAADGAGVHVVINARTDLFKRKDGDEADRFDRAVARMILCAQAGADSLYPVAFHDDDTYRRLSEALPLPVNAIADPSAESLARFAPLGVGRISFGPLWQMALGKTSAKWLESWR